MHFLLWEKASHQSPNFNTSGENLPNSSYHFPNYKSVFLQIVHGTSISSKITPLYFFRSKVIFLAQNRPIKVQVFETFECSNQNPPNSCHFLNNILVFLQILNHSSVSWDISPLYFFSWNFMYFQQKEPNIWWNFTWALESLKFCTLMGSFCPDSINFQLKKYWRVISHDTEKWCKV